MRAKLIALSLFLTLSIIQSANAKTIRQKIEEVVPVGAGSHFSLDNENGAVKISSWDRNEIRIEAEKVVRAGSEDDAKRALKEVKIIIRKDSDGVKVSTETPDDDHDFFDWIMGDDVDAHVSYTVTVPRSMDLDVSTTNGSLQVSAVNGRIELRSVNGRITLTDAGGSVEASTTNGGIEIELARPDLDQEISLSTTNGAISLSLPAGFRGVLDASTTNGSIKSDFPVTTTGTFSSNRLKGTINGGGTKVRLRTTNGGIKVEALN